MKWLKRSRSEVEGKLLVVAMLVVGALLGFVELADEVAEGGTGDFDDWALAAVRRQIVGSADGVVADIALNITALGGYPVLVLFVATVTGFLLLHRKLWQALYVLVATTGGALVVVALKAMFARPRPSLLEPLTPTSGFSFPSGHAFASAVVYLTLGTLVAAIVTRQRAKLYVLSVALMTTGLVGLSRIALGVHYPTDVLAGWLAGLAWALSWWLGFEVLERRRARSKPG